MKTISILALAAAVVAVLPASIGAPPDTQTPQNCPMHQTQPAMKHHQQCFTGDHRQMSETQGCPMVKMHKGCPMQAKQDCPMPATPSCHG